MNDEHALRSVDRVAYPEASEPAPSVLHPLSNESESASGAAASLFIARHAERIDFPRDSPRNSSLARVKVDPVN